MKKFKSIRVKLFLNLTVVVAMMIAFLLIVSSAVLETFYYYNVKEVSIETFEEINKLCIEKGEEDHSREVEKIALENNFEIVIKNQDGIIHQTNKDFTQNFDDMKVVTSEIKYSIFNQTPIIFSDGIKTVRKSQDKIYGLNYILLIGKLENGNDIAFQMPISHIKESVEVSNKFLYVVGICTLIMGGFAINFIAERYTKPIQELSDIAKKMAKLDFSKKYRIDDTDDEINELGRSINTVSNKLEETIRQLKENNIELEKDIEEKSKIDEMRKKFISDVSHELKTPIALIQGYAEGLIENVNTDEESKNFYSEVILDEANKMDKLVKELLELMKLEYKERKFNNENFDIVESINNVLKNASLIIEEKKIDIEFENKEPVMVWGDPFYIEQAITNYFTNALKYVKKIGNKECIKISLVQAKEENKYRVSVYNTGDHISDENLPRVWNRFYKVDESRDRTKGGTGIGLSIVKAIMNNYNNNYGVKNVKNGVEFYFEIEKEKVKEK